MEITLIGAELEENLGLRYLASSLEKQDHRAEIIPLNCNSDTESAIRNGTNFQPEIIGLSIHII